MDMQYLSGRSFSSTTTGFKDKENWDITVVMSETLSYPNGTQREESLEAKASHVDFDTAHKAALQQVLQELQDLVYSRGFDSLIEALDYQRSLEDSDVSTTKADETSSPE